jgi:hypothetical protein
MRAIVFISAMFWLGVRLSAAEDPMVAKIMDGYKGKLSALQAAAEKQRLKVLDDTIKKLKALKSLKMRGGHLDAANAADARIKELERKDSSGGGGELGGLPPPPEAASSSGASHGKKKRFRKPKNPEELKKELMAVNRGYDGRGGRFDIDEGVIVEVELDGCNIVDLGPIANLKYLRSLYLADNPFWDLTPISKLHLRYLNLRRTNVSDLTPIKGMQLVYLDISKTNVRDISVLKGMPLVTLRMEGDVFISDLSPLKKSRMLKTFILPPHVFEMDIDFAKKFKDLKVIDTRVRANKDVIYPGEFWAEYDKRRKGGGDGK